jgi:hypothetical protein
MDPDSLNMFLFIKTNRNLWPNAGIIQKNLNFRPGLDSDDATAEDAEDEEENDDI